MTTTTDPFDARYLDELDLRAELARVFERVLVRSAAFGDPRWGPAVQSVAGAAVGSAVGSVVGAASGGTAAALTPAQHDAIIDAWAAVLAADRSAITAERDSDEVVALVRRALQVRVRNDGLTPRLWVDRTFAGRRAVWARALVRSFGTPAGGGSCRCLDEAPVIDGWQCCGSPWLDNGDLERFIRRARRNVALLDEALRLDAVLALGDPVRRSIVTEAYLTYVGGPATERVAAAWRE